MTNHACGSYDVFASPDKKRPTLLIVDNDALSLLHMAMLLRRFDFQTKTAKTAREALACATATLPALIITTLRLHDMNGLNLIALLKKNPRETGPRELADVFSRQARRRVEEKFRAIRHNDDDVTYTTARHVLDDHFLWLEKGMVRESPEA